MAKHRDGMQLHQLQSVRESDTYLTELGNGHTPAGPDDALAELLLDLRADAHATDTAAIPDFAALLATQATTATADAPGIAATAATTATAASAEPLTADTQVLSLDEHREQRSRRLGPVASALLGAAAATLAIAGGGLVFGIPGQGGTQSAYVELASTLEEVNSKASQGDIDGTLPLLEQARNIVDSLQNGALAAKAEPVTTTETSTVTTTAEPARPEPAPAVTVTETVTVTKAPAATTPATTTTPASSSSAPAKADGTQKAPQRQEAGEPAPAAVVVPAER